MKTARIALPFLLILLVLWALSAPILTPQLIKLGESISQLQAQSSISQPDPEIMAIQASIDDLRQDWPAPFTFPEETLWTTKDNFVRGIYGLEIAEGLLLLKPEKGSITMSDTKRKIRIVIWWVTSEETDLCDLNIEMRLGRHKKSLPLLQEGFCDLNNIWEAIKNHQDEIVAFLGNGFGLTVFQEIEALFKIRH